MYAPVRIAFRCIYIDNSQLTVFCRYHEQLNWSVVVCVSCLFMIAGIFVQSINKWITGYED